MEGRGDSVTVLLVSIGKWSQQLKAFSSPLVYGRCFVTEVTCKYCYYSWHTPEGAQHETKSRSPETTLKTCFRWQRKWGACGKKEHENRKEKNRFLQMPISLPPMRKRSPATYCIRPRSQQHPSTPIIHPNRMMATAMPMKPAVILRRSAVGKTEKKHACEQW